MHGGRATCESFCDSYGFGVLLFCRDDYDGTARPRAETNFFLNTWCSNPFPRFLVYAEFNKCRL